MLIIHHLLITAIIGLFAFFSGYLSFIEFSIFVLGGIFVDIDHIPSYWYYKKEYSLNYNNIKNWCFSIGYRMEHFYPFHTIWFVLILFLLRQIHPAMLFLFLGVLLHVFLDIIWDMYWYFILKKNARPYRRWFAPISWLRKGGMEKVL